jgi:hypothetical protein
MVATSFPSGRGGGATRFALRDPAPYRSTQAESAADPDMSIRRGAARDRPRAAKICRTAGHKLRTLLRDQKGLFERSALAPRAGTAHSGPSGINLWRYNAFG